MDLHPKQFVRVDVQTLEDAAGRELPLDEPRHLIVDGRTVTMDRLRQLVAKAMDIRGEFCVSLLGPRGERVPLSCDWDLEGVLSEGETSIRLALRLEPQEPGLEEWDIICPVDVPVEALRPPAKRSFLEQVFRPAPPPLTEAEFRRLSDCPVPLRHAVYRAGGADPRLRSRLWLHLVDVYPTTGRCDRRAFVNRKAEEYYALRHAWQRLEREGTVPAALKEMTCLVRKDVRRTDPPLDLDERALYNVLTTYAVHHPSVSYRQGMSDLLSPLLRVMGTEAGAYLAFCGLMQRMRDNFRRDGRPMRLKFRHLRRVLRLHDPPLHRHLKKVGALELLFCYRWLLLDLKREFPHRDAPTLAEVLWSTLPPLPSSERGVALFEARLLPEDDGPKESPPPPPFGPSSVREGSSSEDEEPEKEEPRRRSRRKTRNPHPTDNYGDRSQRRRRGSSCDSNYGSALTDDEEESSRDRSEGYYTSGPDDPSPFSSSGEEEEEEEPAPLLPPPTRLGGGKPFLLFLCLTLLTEHRDEILRRRMDAGEIGIYFDAWVRRHPLDRVMTRARERFDEYLRTGWTED